MIATSATSQKRKKGHKVSIPMWDPRTHWKGWMICFEWKRNLFVLASRVSPLTLGDLLAMLIWNCWCNRRQINLASNSRGLHDPCWKVILIFPQLWASKNISTDTTKMASTHYFGWITTFTYFETEFLICLVICISSLQFIWGEDRRTGVVWNHQRWKV
jgi:hypothetical protein